MADLIPRRSSLYREVERVSDANVVRAMRRVTRNPNLIDKDNISESITELAMEDSYKRNPELHERVKVFNARDVKANTFLGAQINVDKPARALYKKLKVDGLIKSTIYDIGVEWGDLDACYQTVILGYGSCFSEEVCRSTLTKSMWIDAITLAITYRCRDNVIDVNTYLPTSSDEWKDLYFLVCLVLLFRKEAEITEAAQQKEPPPEPEIIKVKDESAEKRALELAKQLQQVREQYRREHRESEASYNRIIREKDAQIAELQSALNTLLPQESVLPGDLTEELNIEVLEELPETGVTFIGAHPRMTRRLQEKHPNWDYIPLEQLPAQYPDNPICFVNVSFMPHRQYFHITAGCHSTILTCHLKNLDRLEEELKQAYTQYVCFSYNNS